MKFLTSKTSALAMMIAGTMVLGGCFGPFKKKSSGGGGGGGSTEETEGEGSGGGSGSGSKNSGTTDDTPPAPGAKDGYGCLQGVVTDGFTGQRIALDATKMFVLIRGTKIPANVIAGDDNL